MLSHLLHIDRLSAFGLVAVGLMLAFYAVEDKSRHYTLLFAIACAMGSAYGFMQGAWPFGLVEGIWSLVALRKWLGRPSSPPPSTTAATKLRDTVDGFLEDLRGATTQVGPTSYAFAGDGGTPIGYVQLYRPCRGRVLIHRIWAVSPGHGVGTRMMQTLCELADLHGVEIALRALPFGPKPFPMSAEELRRWYHRHGFAGTMKSMIRNPAAMEIENAREVIPSGPLAPVLRGEG